MQVDKQFEEWWTDCLGNPPIPCGYVIPILKNLQGHPKGPRLWDIHIRGNPDLHTRPMNHVSTSSRQVDDFIIAAKDLSICKTIRAEIQSYTSREPIWLSRPSLLIIITM
jgi:hypothetical protein